MNATKSKRTYAAQPAIHGKVRLVSTQVPSLEKVTPEVYSRLTTKQQVELVGRLIEFLKTF
jgi:hypothetical protein